MSVTIQLVNNRPTITAPANATNPADYELNIMITGASITNLGNGIQNGESMTWSEFITKSPDATITFDYINSGRIYFGYGTLPYGTKTSPATVGAEYLPAGDASGSTVQPVPYWKRYYGVAEITYLSGNPGLYLDITNVNLVALPMTFSGTTILGQDFSLGYKGAITSIRTKLEGLISSTSPCPGPSSKKNISSKLTCVANTAAYPLSKIVSPTAGNAGCYNRSFDPYVTALKQYSTQISITSDTTTSGVQEIFTGGFKNATGAGDNVIELTGNQGDKLNITLGNFSNDNIYACANGQVEFNGVNVPMNASSKNSTLSAGQRTLLDSTVRNIFIGMNEGRFLPATTITKTVAPQNDNTNWASTDENGKYGPFPNNNQYGSEFAQVIYENTNAYGYPYADKYLNALAIANIEQPITLTACPDTGSCGYDPVPPLSSSPYSFNIGIKSSALGNIYIGEGQKSAPIAPTSTGSYDGQILVTSGMKTQRMYFKGPNNDYTNKYVIINMDTATATPETTVYMKDANGNYCFLSNGKPYSGAIWWSGGDNGAYVISLPADLSWNPKAGPAVIPTS